MTLWLWTHHKRRILLIKILFLLFNQLVIGIYGRLCEVETGQNNIIADIEESRGSYIGQRTSPPEMPIHGDVDDEITLGLNFSGSNPLFKLNGKQLQLLHPLDRDKENLSHIMFHISCTIKSTRRNRNIPVIIRVSDLNDNVPEFVNTPYENTIPESTPVGTTIYSQIKADDVDAGVNGLVEYFLIEGPKNATGQQAHSLTTADGFGVFAIAYPHQGHVTVVKTLDYERIQRYYLTIVASDRARNITERLSATTTLTVNVIDTDDQDPSFVYRDCLLFDGACINPEYKASIVPGTLDENLEILPEPIKAVDLDAIGSSIRYSFVSGTPRNFGKYFKIDEISGIVNQMRIVDSSVIAREFELVVRAEEVSDFKRFTTAKLIINVKASDIFPPVISATSSNGFVDENSPVGTRVLDKKGNPILFRTTDADFTNEEMHPLYAYEITNSQFIVSKDGVLLVNEENLDRDPPNSGKFKFQIVAREIKGNAASTPLSVTVSLRDINDNAPKLNSIPPISITAGNSKRIIATANATDIDNGINALIHYSIRVTSDGGRKFRIDESSGSIELIGRAIAGEHFNITVRATDSGHLFTETSFTVSVVPGLNTKPPKFMKYIHDALISENAEINSTVAVLKAEDPEGDTVRYSIISGNDLRQFSIGQENGIISVIRSLDRESLTRYQLIIRAEDSGGLSSTATVNIKITDINDANPIFDEDYIFYAREEEVNFLIGKVHATDADEGVNSEITYFIPKNVPFIIDSKSGQIKTKSKLDYEALKEYKFLVTAKDGALLSRIGTATITVRVQDAEDEVPKFAKNQVEIRVPENIPDLLVTTVQAIDPDTNPKITYVFKNSVSSLFKINSNTGEIKTVGGLDFEKNRMHEIIVGTVENPGREKGDTLLIKVQVEDRNDVPPVFVSIPEPISIKDDLPIGTVVASMPAIDGDGSAPGNIVRYEMVGRGKSLKYFQIDPDTGDIRIQDDLRKEKDSDYQIEIKAYDLGDPSLSSLIVLPINVQQRNYVNRGQIESRIDSESDSSPESIELGFNGASYTTSLPESTGINAIIYRISFTNSKTKIKNKSSLKCEIKSGNELSQFAAIVDDNACCIKLIQQLDFENQTSHELGIQLSSTKYSVNPNKSFATFKVHVTDKNDHKPIFKFPKSFKHRTRNDTFYGVLNWDASVGTSVLQAKAYDQDSGVFGLIKYKIFDDESNFISNDDLPSRYFSISEDTGVLKTKKLLHTVREKPMIFFIEARDNNGMDSKATLTTRARIVVNIISDINRMTLVISDSSPKDVRRHVRALEDMLLEKSDGLVTGIEKFSNRRSMTQNGSIVELPEATDVWFYAIDPQNEKILERNSSEVFSKLLEPNVQSQINYAASRLIRATADGIFGPLETESEIRKLEVADSASNKTFHYSLISIAAVIFLLFTIGIIYSCFWWSKYKNSKIESESSSNNLNTQMQQRDPNKIHFQNAHAVQVNLKDLIVAYDGSAR